MGFGAPLKRVIFYGGYWWGLHTGFVLGSWPSISWVWGLEDNEGGLGVF